MVSNPAKFQFQSLIHTYRFLNVKVYHSLKYKDWLQAQLRSQMLTVDAEVDVDITLTLRVTVPLPSEIRNYSKKTRKRLTSLSCAQTFWKAPIQRILAGDGILGSMSMFS